jgi:hypothetical protein
MSRYISKICFLIYKYKSQLVSKIYIYHINLLVSRNILIFLYGERND